MLEDNINNKIIVYDNGEIELKVSVDDKNETVWLTQKQIVQLFQKDQSVISRHINKIFQDGEVDEKSNMQKMHIANSDKPVKFYSIDVVLSVGYRTNSQKAIKFRKWATKILKQYIVNGYSINTHKITEQRLLNLENDMQMVKSKIKNDKLELKQGIFYDGQIWDAYMFVNNLLKSAKKEIVLIDGYIDDTILTLFSKYKNLEVKISTKYHDRFLIIDKNEVYHIGASLKDLGNKVFAFSKIDKNIIENLNR